MNLNNWVELARAHWKEFLPAKYAALKKAGALEAALREAAEQTYQATSALEAAGHQPHEAWAMAREDHLLLKPETTAAEEMFEERPLLKLQIEMQRLNNQILQIDPSLPEGEREKEVERIEAELEAAIDRAAR